MSFFVSTPVCEHEAMPKTRNSSRRPHRSGNSHGPEVSVRACDDPAGRPPGPEGKKEMPMRALRVPFLPTAAVLLVLAGAPAPAATVPARDARITDVTVYRDRAEVVREATVRLPAGASTVEFAGIPVGVEPDSLRVQATGVGAVLGAVEIVEVAAEAEDTPELVAAREEVERLERALAALDGDARVDDQLGKFLASLQAAAAGDASRDLGEGGIDTASIASLYDLLAERLGALAARDLDRARERRELGRELELARAHLGTLRPSGGIRSRVATVDIEAGEIPQDRCLEAQVGIVGQQGLAGRGPVAADRPGIRSGRETLREA